MEEFQRRYHKYPKYPVADAGYGNLNNYLYCEEHYNGPLVKTTLEEIIVNTF